MKHDDSAVISTRLGKREHKSLKRIAKQTRRSIASCVRIFVEDGIEKELVIEESGVGSMRLRHAPHPLSERTGKK